MNVFYERSLKTILDKSSSRKHRELRKCVKSIQKTLKQKKSIEELLKSDPATYFRPFILACKTNKSSIVEKGLDSIQKLTSYGFLKDKALVHSIISAICEVFLPIQEDLVRIQLIKALLHLVLNQEIHGKELRDIIKTCFNIYLVSENVIIEKTAKAALTQILNNVFGKIEILSEQNLSVAKSEREYVHLWVERCFESVIRKNSKFFSESHKDGVVIFNALCRLSMKKINNKNTLELRNRVLSLEMIHSILEQSGSVFKSSAYFIEDIKRILCISLLENSVCGVPEIFSQALQIFKTLIFYFNKPLKNEIGMFFTNCILQILESSYSSFFHKGLVLDILSEILGNDQIFIDLFINYDCSLKDVDIVENTVYEVANSLLNASQFVKDKWITGEEAKELRHKALSVLSRVMKILYGFIEEEGEHIRSEEESMDDFLMTQHKNPMVDTENESEESGNESSTLPAVSKISRVEMKSEMVDFREGVKIFNDKSPQKGIEYLVQTKRLKDTPQEIARFFLEFRERDLAVSLARIGEYLGGHKQKNLAVLHEFVFLSDFRGMGFSQAFRKFLTSFRIPGEGQQIDRIIQKFAQGYMAQNSERAQKVFKNNDSAYFFAYSVMMLHTDLHNPNLRFRQRMTLDGFINLIKGGNEGEDYDEAFVREVYTDIKEREIQILGPKEDPLQKMLEKKNSRMEGKREQNIENLLVNKQKKKRLLFENESQKIINDTRRQFGQEWKKRMEEEKMAAAAAGKKTSPKKKKKEVSELPEVHLSEASDDSDDSDYSGGKRERNFHMDVSNLFHESTESDKKNVLTTLFKVIYKPISEAIGEYMKKTKNMNVVHTCLEALETAIFVGSRLGLESSTMKFSELLCTNTGLFAEETSVLGPKNLECIRVVKKLVITERNFLGPSWVFYLDCISRLDRLKEYGKGQKLVNPNVLQKSEKSGMGRKSKTPSKKKKKRKKIHHQKSLSVSNLDDINFSKLSREEREAVTEKYYHQLNYINIFHGNDQMEKIMEEPFVDRLFMQTTLLNDMGIVNFVAALCTLGERELKSETDPRDFCLKKLVNTAVDNIPTRSQIVWGRLWGLLSEHLISTSCHDNEKISMLSIDALKQITYHFFRVEELETFHFQRNFLKPFFKIMVSMVEKNVMVSMRMMIVDCIGNLIKARLDNLRSGWATILEFFITCCKDPDKDIVRATFSYIKMIIEKDRYFNSLLMPDFRNYAKFVELLIEFALNKTDFEFAQRMITLIEIFAKKIVEPRITKETFQFTEKDAGLWIPLLHGLSRGVHDENLMEIRIMSLETVFKIIHQTGKFFNKALWGVIFRGSLLSLFDDINQKEMIIETDWMKNTCHKSLSFLIEMFINFYSKISFLFDEILALINNIITKNSERLCYIGTDCMLKLVRDSSTLLTKENWDKIVTFESDLLSKLEGEENSQKMVLNIIDALIREKREFLSDDNLQMLVSAVHGNIDRCITKEMKYTTMRHKVDVLFVLFDDKYDQLVKTAFIEALTLNFTEYCAFFKKEEKMLDDPEFDLINSLINRVLLLIVDLKNPDKFSEIFFMLHELFCDLIVSNDKQIRLRLVQIFKKFKK